MKKSKKITYHNWSRSESMRIQNLWNHGLSATQIANLYGTKFTRGMILGRLWRLKNKGWILR